MRGVLPAEPPPTATLMPYYVYVIRSQSANRRYVGQTDDLEQRLERHNAGLVFSTAPYRPWQLIHSEEFKTRADSMRRERELKTGKGRQWIKQHLLGGC